MLRLQFDQTAIRGRGLIKLFTLVMYVADGGIDFGALLTAAQGPFQLNQRFITLPIEVQRNSPGEQLRRGRLGSHTRLGGPIRPTLLVTHALLLWLVYRQSTGKP